MHEPVQLINSQLNSTQLNWVKSDNDYWAVPPSHPNQIHPTWKIVKNNFDQIKSIPIQPYPTLSNPTQST